MFQIRKYAEIAFDARADMQVSVAVRLPLRRGCFVHEKRDTARVSLLVHHQPRGAAHSCQIVIQPIARRSFSAEAVCFTSLRIAFLLKKIDRSRKPAR